MEFSKIVEENDVCLTDRRAVSNPITFNDRKVSMTFDGVSHIREPLSIILQVITDDRNTGQNLVCFQLRHHLLGRRQLTSKSQICNFCMGFNISHTTDHVGVWFILQLGWVHHGVAASSWLHSPNAQHVYRCQMDKAVKLYGKTGWWSQCEVGCQ